MKRSVPAWGVVAVALLVPAWVLAVPNASNAQERQPGGAPAAARAEGGGAPNSGANSAGSGGGSSTMSGGGGGASEGSSGGGGGVSGPSGGGHISGDSGRHVPAGHVGAASRGE